MVKSVFKTLLKVPCYIVIGYLVMNIVMFAAYYIKALGLSYAVMQVAVENNYIPEQELMVLSDTMSAIGSQVTYDENGNPVSTNGNDTLNISSVSDFGMFIDTDSSTATAEELYSNNNTFENGTRITEASNNNRRQYGKPITVGIGYMYHPVLPIPSGNTANNQNVYSDDINASANIMEYENVSVDSNGNALSIPITITYRVPGLKYYPDM